MELNTFPQTCTFHWIHFWNEFIQICCSEPIYRYIDILLSKQNNWSTHTSPRNSLSSSWTLGWSQTVISNMRSLKSLRWMWEYRNVWFHFGSALFFTVFVLLLLLSLEECSMFKRVCTLCKTSLQISPKNQQRKSNKKSADSISTCLLFNLFTWNAFYKLSITQNGKCNSGLAVQS